MNRSRLMMAAATLSAVVTVLFFCRIPVHAQMPPSATEYATVRWGGRENTHIIRPGGKVEFIGPELRKFPRPDRCDERSFFMNIAMNGLVKEGWEFAGMTADDIVMRRGGK